MKRTRNPKRRLPARPDRQRISKAGRALQFATLLVEWIHEAIAAGDLDALETCLLVVREAAHRFGLQAQKARAKLFGAAKDIPDEELNELVGRFVGLHQMQNAIVALEVVVEQRLTDAGRFTHLQ